MKPSRNGAARRPSVRRQLAAMLALAVAPSAVFAVAEAVRTYHEKVDDAARAFLSESIVAARRERDAFSGVRYAVTALTASPAIRDVGGADCMAAVGSFDSLFGEYILALVIDAEGTVRCASQPDAIGMDLSSSPVVREMIADPSFRLTLRPRGAVTAREVLVASAPLAEAGALQGLVAVSVPADIFRYLSGPGQDHVRRAIVDREGRILLDQANDDAAQDWLPAPAALRARFGWTEQVYTDAGGDAVERIYALSPLWEGGAWLVAGAEARTVREGLALRSFGPIALPIATLLIAVAVAYYGLDRLVARRLIHLSRLTRAYGAGRLRLRPQSMDDAPREIATLAEQMAAMAGRLEARHAELAQRAEENRILLLEVYHRVRNNLQLIASLLTFQAQRAENAEERAALVRTRGRVYSMAAAHEALYASSDMARVPIDDLVRRLAERTAADAPGGAAPAITLRLDSAEESAERATPFSLFANEALMDAVACAARRGGDVDVALERSSDGGFTFTVGRPSAGADLKDVDAAMVRRLTDGFARQLRGAVERTTADGRDIVRLIVPPRPSEKDSSTEKT